MKVLLQLRLQISFDNSLRDAIRDCWYSQRSLPTASLVYLHSLYWRWEVAARGQAIPELVQIIFQICLELLDRLLVHAGRSPVRLYPFIRFPNQPLGNTPRLCFTQKTPPVSG